MLVHCSCIEELEILGYSCGDSLSQRQRRRHTKAQQSLPENWDHLWSKATRVGIGSMKFVGRTIFALKYSSICAHF